MKLSNHPANQISNFTRRATALFLAALLLIPQTVLADTLRIGELVSSIGTIQVAETRTLSPGVVWNSYKALKSSASPLVVQSVTIDPANPSVELRTFYGSSVTARETLSKIISEERKDGEQVVAGVNGDFFTLATGTPSGLLIHNGELLSSDGSYVQCFGIHADGTAQIGDPSLAFALKGSAVNVPLLQINKDQTDKGVFLFTEDFGATTATKTPSREIVLQADGNPLRIGGTVRYTVVEVRENAMATPLGANRAVVSAQVGKTGFELLGAMKVGDVFDLVVNDLDGRWSDIRQAIGGRTRLVRDGVVVPGLSSTNANPMTLIGVRTDGQIVLVEADGRQSGYSTGISHLAAAYIMLEAGCVDALELDGGGSSTVSLRTPGYVAPSIVNKPSEGSERAVSNGLLILSKSEPAAAVNAGTGLLDASAATQLHLYPGTAYLMPGTTAAFHMAATDDVQYPAVVPAGAVFETEGGAVSASTAADKATQPWMISAGTTAGRFIVNARAGRAAGTSEFIVVDRLTSILPSKTALHLAGGQSFDLSATGVIDGISVVSRDDLFTWTIAGDVGTITSDGIFTASADASAAGRSGTVRIAHGTAFTTVSVGIASRPIVLEEFELAAGWTTELLRGTSATAVVKSNAAEARYGSGYLELSYDFVLAKGAEGGTAGAYAGPATPASGSVTPVLGGIAIPNAPTALSMWVYGDGSGNWLRSKLTDAAGRTVDVNWTTEYSTSAKSGGIDWTGWKYVTAQVPNGLTAPYSLSTPIRVMCTTDAKRTSGILRFDRLKAIYVNDSTDVTGPVVASLIPASGSVQKTGALPISAFVTDGTDGVGVKMESLQLKIDGVVQPEAVIKAENGGYAVSRIYEAKAPLSAGYHTATIVATDSDGNPSTNSWSFSVDTATPSIRIAAPVSAKTGEPFTVDVLVKNPNTLRTLTLNLKYDRNMLELVDANAAKAGLQVGMEKWVASGKQVKHLVDSGAGTIAFEVQNLNSTLKLTERKALTLTFRMKTSAVNTGDMVLSYGSMLAVGGTTAQTFAVPRVKVANGFPLILTVSGFENGTTTLVTVRDASGALVPNANILMPSHGDGTLLVTGADGTTRTSLLTMLPAGTEFTLQAVSGSRKSDVMHYAIQAAATVKDAEQQPETEPEQNGELF